MTLFVALVGLAAGEPVLLVVVVPLAAATYLFWYHSSGKLRERLRETRRRPGTQAGESRGGFDAGPRGGFDGARGRRAREAWERQNRRRREGADSARGPGPQPGMSRAEAYRRLGLEEDADEREVKRAYRRKVKEVHPDRGGDEDEFRKVLEAYETLTG